MRKPRRQLAETRTELDQAEAKARLGRLFGQFLALEDAVRLYTVRSRSLTRAHAPS